MARYGFRITASHQLSTKQNCLEMTMEADASHTLYTYIVHLDPTIPTVVLPGTILALPGTRILYLLQVQAPKKVQGSTVFF